MSTAKDVRAALASGPLAFRKLHEKVGGDDMKLRKALSNLEYTGWLTVGEDEDRTVSLKARRAGKKPAGKRGGKAVKKSAPRSSRRSAKRPYKALADLRRVLKEQVENIEDNPVMQFALTNYERAENLYAAARAV